MAHCETIAEHDNYCSSCFTCHDCLEQAELHDRNKLAELEQQLKTAQDSAIKNAETLQKVVNAILDNANGYPEDTVYNIACIVGLEVG